MKTLFFGAGPLGCLYAHLLHTAGQDVTLVARGDKRDHIEEHGLKLVNEITRTVDTSHIPVTSVLDKDDDYDLIVVLIRKNMLGPVFEVLKANQRVQHILFMGNNALGFDAYLEALPAKKILFGFPGAGGGFREHTVHYADREKASATRRAITIGEMDGVTRPRTQAIKAVFESSGVPVDTVDDIDGWLKYHLALVLPIADALYVHNCDNQALARDKATLRKMVRAAREGGNVLRALGYTKRQPFRFNLFYWMPEPMVVKVFQSLMDSTFAEIAFAMHAAAGRDEIVELRGEFSTLVERTTVPTPYIDALSRASG
jgi:2-dehydropantoate 2-reductase